ncbi:hypothetical protein MMC32_001491 [Xylographa parallela]|nr:hypothetical protein [Xylographa parallela]
MPSLPSVFRFSKQQQTYEAVGHMSEPYDEAYSIKALLSEETSSDSNSSEHLPPYRLIPAPAKHVHTLFLVLNIVFFVFSAFLFGISTAPTLWPRDKFNNTLLRQTSEHSPIFDQVHVPFLKVKRNGSFVPTDPPSIFRQEPSPAVDEAWARLGRINPVPLSSADVVKLGADPAKTARFPESFGFGPDAHIGRIDVFHQIHCLNSLRREIHFDYYHGADFRDRKPAPDHYVHVNHCLDVLLQNLMCTAPLNPILHYWVEGLEEPFPNFDDNHQCHDFDTVLSWFEEKSVDMKHYRATMKRPAGVHTEKLSHTYLALLENTDALERFRHNQEEAVESILPPS